MSDFLAALFGGGVTEETIFLCSLENDSKGGTVPSIHTRDMAEVSAFCAQWDKAGRGLFFSVGTIPEPKPRRKENVAETAFLHADIDLKDVDMTALEVILRLDMLSCRPSVINLSGHGVHAYWLFHEAEQPDERIENALRQLADLVGGDFKVCHPAALMRLPGTHNTKRGEWTEVVIHRADYGLRYNLTDLEDMLALMAPVIRRKDAVPTGVEPNPYLAIASRLNFKPPVDVEARLEAMTYGGVGNTSIHETQVSVSAALLNSGMPIDEVVATILAATRSAAGPMGERWNWKREEIAIRRMCQDWVKKHPPAPVVQIKHARAEREEAKAKAEPKSKPEKEDKAKAHVVLGEAVIEALRSRGEDILLTAAGEQVWRYEDGLWSLMPGDGRRWLDVEIEMACRGMSLTSTTRLVGEARTWIMRHPGLHKKEIAWDEHGKVPTISGLVDPRTLTIEPAKPEHYATWRVECPYEPAAACPWWEQMLADTFQDRSVIGRAETIAVFQEAYGSSFIKTKPRALNRAIVLQGGSESGKTQILNVLAGPFSARPISTPLEALDGAHGTMEFHRWAPWVLHEAFDQGKWHFSSKAKQILSGDPTQINIKNGPVITQPIKIPIFWGTNHPPQFKEATAAIVNRMLVFRCRAEFDRYKPVGAAAEGARLGFSEPSDFVLATELPGLLNWALAGLQRALARGHLPTTAELDETLHEIRTDSNMAAGFVEECVTFTPNGMVSVPDFCAAFSVWWGENKGTDRTSPSNESIGKAVAALGNARIGHDPKEMRDTTRRYYVGIHLNQTGTDYWAGAANAGLAQGKTARISTARDDVNRSVPGSWDGRESLVRLRMAFASQSKKESVSSDMPEKTVMRDRPAF